jgi:hypothetical protein
MTLFHESTVHPSAPASRLTRIPPFRAAALLLAAVLFLPACSGNSNPVQASSQLRFGVDMARRGLWSEALFRFQEAQRLEPQSPRILNNLAVASEALGQFDMALEYYKRALQIAPDSREARANYSRFVEFYQSFRGPQKARARPGQPGAPGQGTAAAPGAAPEPADQPSPPNLPVTPPGQAPVEQPKPPTGNVATPPTGEPQPSSPPPPPPPGEATR